jgi:hypothetical protein
MLGIPHERQAVHHRQRCRRIVWPAHGDRHAANFAGHDEPDEDLLAFRGDLHDLESPVQEDVEFPGIGPLLKHGRPFRDAPRGRLGEDGAQAVVVHGLEQVEAADQGGIEAGHGGAHLLLPAWPPY